MTTYATAPRRDAAIAPFNFGSTDACAGLLAPAIENGPRSLEIGRFPPSAIADVGINRSEMKRVVYTCLFGHSELFNDFAYERDGLDFVCFTDDPELRSDFWKIELLSRGILDPARAAKKIKALPHIYLAAYDWSLYVDNTVHLKTAPRGTAKSGGTGASASPTSPPRRAWCSAASGTSRSCENSEPNGRRARRSRRTAVRSRSAWRASWVFSAWR